MENIYQKLLNEYEDGSIESILRVASRLKTKDAVGILYSSEPVILFFMEWYYSLTDAADPKQAAIDNRGCAGCRAKSFAFCEKLITYLEQRHKND